MPRLVKSSELNSNEYDHTIRSKNPEVLNKKIRKKTFPPDLKSFFVNYLKSAVTVILGFLATLPAPIAGPSTL